MTGSEAQRVDLYNGLSELIGPERADTLMSYLPTTPAAQLATKDDLLALTMEVRSGFAAIDRRFQKIDERFEKIDERFEKITEKFERVDERFNWLTDSTHGLYKTIIWSMVASITVMSAIVTLVVYGLTR